MKKRFNDTFYFIMLLLLSIFMIIVGLLMSSCAWHGAVYSGLDAAGKPYTIELTARRFAMGQEVQGFAAEFPGGYKVGFDSAHAYETKVLANFLGVLGPILQAYINAQPGAIK